MRKKPMNDKGKEGSQSSAHKEERASPGSGISIKDRLRVLLEGLEGGRNDLIEGDKEHNAGREGEGDGKKGGAVPLSA